MDDNHEIVMTREIVGIWIRLGWDLVETEKKNEEYGTMAIERYKISGTIAS